METVHWCFQRLFPMDTVGSVRNDQSLSEFDWMLPLISLQPAAAVFIMDRMPSGWCPQISFPFGFWRSTCLLEVTSWKHQDIKSRCITFTFLKSLNSDSKVNVKCRRLVCDRSQRKAESEESRWQELVYILGSPYSRVPAGICLKHVQLEHLSSCLLLERQMRSLSARDGAMCFHIAKEAMAGDGECVFLGWNVCRFKQTVRHGFMVYLISL